MLPDLAKENETMKAACLAALDALREMYDRIEGGADVDDLLGDETLWPLEQLRVALGMPF